MAERLSQTAIAAEPEPVTEPEPGEVREDELVESELLVEEVSIDGMCGVY
jgi:mycofactocin precursor